MGPLGMLEIERKVGGGEASMLVTSS